MVHWALVRDSRFACTAKYNYSYCFDSCIVSGSSVYFWVRDWLTYCFEDSPQFIRVNVARSVRIVHFESTLKREIHPMWYQYLHNSALCLITFKSLNLCPCLRQGQNVYEDKWKSVQINVASIQKQVERCTKTRGKSRNYPEDFGNGWLALNTRQIEYKFRFHILAPFILKNRTTDCNPTTKNSIPTITIIKL